MNINATMAREVWPLFAVGNDFRAAVEKVPNTAMRNLLAASIEAQVPEELLIFLQYQQGRRILDSQATQQIEKQIKRLCAASLRLQNSQALPDKDLQTIAEDLKKVRAFLGHVVRMHRALVL